MAWMLQTHWISAAAGNCASKQSSGAGREKKAGTEAETSHGLVKGLSWRRTSSAIFRE